MDRLTDLEAVALGHLHRTRGATAYAVRRVFRDSPSARFGDSAGSVYPMLKRLAERGLAETREEPRGARPGTVYRCTRDGLAALRAWIAIPDGTTRLVTTDPLRTRAIHLGALSRAQRLRWVERAERSLDEHVAAIEAFDATCGDDVWLHLANRNTLLEAEARRAWLREVRREIERPT